MTMMGPFWQAVLTILIVFYLYLLVRPAFIKRNFCFILGACAIVVSMLLIGILDIWSDKAAVSVLCGIFGAILDVIAFGSAVGACYGGKLPAIAEKLDQQQQ